VPVSYVGGPGAELYVPVEKAVALYDALHAAGATSGLRDCGYYALDALRLEAGGVDFRPSSLRTSRPGRRVWALQ
jgi:4-methylaminobutanoate oxidase (formaldehyde-forming)